MEFLHLQTDHLWWNETKKRLILEDTQDLAFNKTKNVQIKFISWFSVPDLVPVVAPTLESKLDGTGNHSIIESNLKGIYIQRRKDHW